MKQHLPFIVFVHVEKAGGISINNMLHHYIDGYVSPSPRWGETMQAPDLKTIQKFYPRKIKGVGGHRMVASESYSNNQFVFSFVREPIARLLSHLNWQIHKMDIAHSFESFVSKPYFQNFQTYRLTRSRDYQTAKEIIRKHYSFVGISEKFDLSINLLSLKLFGEVGKLNYQRLNETKLQDKTYKPSLLSDSRLKQLQKLNQTDIDVYKLVQEQFLSFKEIDEQVHNYNPSSMHIPFRTIVMRKISNYYIGHIIQPRLMKQVPFGH
jgi:hypothetical protein